MTKPRKVSTDRRNFLLAAAGGVAAVAGATGAAVSNATTAASPARQEPKKDPAGYRVTEHVSRYYEKARF